MEPAADRRGDFTFSGGQLSFASPPDFESPVDSGRNNVYNVRVRATARTKSDTPQRGRHPPRPVPFRRSG